MLPVCRGYSFTFSAFQCVSNDTCKPENTAFLLLVLFAYWIVFILVLFVILSLKLSIGSGFMYGIVYFFSIASLYVRSSELYNEWPWLQFLMYINVAITQFDPGFLGYVNWNVCFDKSWDSHLHHELFRLATPLFVVMSVILLVLVARYCRIPRYLSLAENTPIHASCLLILISILLHVLLAYNFLPQ